MVLKGHFEFRDGVLWTDVQFVIRHPESQGTLARIWRHY